MLKVGILGVGAIGQILATAIDQKRIDAQLVALSDQDVPKAKTFAARLAQPPPVVSLDELMERSELAVEAASQEALWEFVPKALAHGRDMMIMSAGGLLAHEDWFHQAAERSCRIYVPSGAIAGLDGIKSASIGRLQSALLVSRKPIAALKGTRYVLEKGLLLDYLNVETTIFEGSAEQAARAFPTTSNVAASLHLAVGGRAPVRVRIIAVPGGQCNIHEIRVQGEFGRLCVTVENVPSEANPRTSKLAAFSALATLRGLTQSSRIGT
jgi:aspartate dehydrogenase